MKEDAFKELCQAVREGGRILRGAQKPSRRFVVSATNIQATRKRMRLTQARFAHLLGVPTSTLRNWEQGRTDPDGPAKALLTVVEREPRAVLRALHPEEARV
ncbi:MAG: helix-turn-helix domain-containing protein [Planctomycetes bacterium]|nr:helix-turn-helix domain-containing protein [Planctomycetota bacterium]